MSQFKNNKWNAFIFLNSLIFVFFSLFVMSGRLTWLDEDFTLFLISQPWSDFWHIISIREMNMSLYYVFLKLWSLISADALFLRTLSLAFSLLTALYVYKITLKVSSKQSAIVAVVVCFFSAILFRYSQELRGYSLFALASTVATYYWLEVVNKDTLKSWCCFTLSCVFVFYSHMLGAIIITSQFILLVLLSNFDKKKLAKVGLSTAVIWLLISPLVLQFLQLGSNPISWAQTLTVRSGIDLLNDLFVSPFIDSNKVRLFVLTLFIFLIYRLLKRQENQQQHLLALLVLSLGGFALIALYTPIMHARFAINLVPLFIVLVAIGFTKLDATFVKVPIAVAFFSVWGVSIMMFTNKAGDDWQQVKFELMNSCQADGRTLVAYYKPSALLGLHSVKTEILENCPNIQFITPFAAKSLYSKSQPGLPTNILLPNLSDYSKVWLIEYYVPADHVRLAELHQQLSDSYSKHETFPINSNGNFIRLNKYEK